MLNLPISGVESVIFLVFLGIWAGFLFGGFLYGKLSQDETRRMPISTRLLSSFTLVIAAWTWFAITQGTQIDTFATWVAVGMSLGFIGDVIMAQVFDFEDYVIFGMLAFGLGHIAYIIGMAILAFSVDISLLALIMPILVWWLIAAVLWYFVVFRGSEATTTVYLALPYAMLLATTVSFAMILTMLDGTFMLVIIGAILFLLSDLILAAQLFNNLHFKYISDVVWLTYGPGQMLIVFGVILYTMIDSFLKLA